jgi:hypothetical protein
MEDARRAQAGVPPYVVHCVVVDRASEAAGHPHVVGIETSDPDGGRTKWTLLQVIAAFRDGERFMVGSAAGGQTVELGPSVCPRCRLVTLSPEPDLPGIDLARCF